MPIFHNRTRRSSSIPRKLIAQGKFYLLPLYYLLMTSELAREGVRNSGSYRFADHIYANQPQGRFLIGRVIDGLLLNLKSARSLRSRYIYAKVELHKLIAATSPDEELDILAVPCGLAREFFEVAEELEQRNPDQRLGIKWHGLDLDRELTQSLKQKAREQASDMDFWVGDALNHTHYPRRYNMIVSTGLTEFLGDIDTLKFYQVVHRQLKGGGILFTSGMTKHRLSDYLLRNLAELHTQYRSREQLVSLVTQAGFGEIKTYQHELQTIVVATKS